METEILCKALTGSFGVSRPDEVAVVCHALGLGWLDAIVSTASSDAPIDNTRIALVLGLTPNGLAHLNTLRATPFVN